MALLPLITSEMRVKNSVRNLNSFPITYITETNDGYRMISDMSLAKCKDLTGQFEYLPKRGKKISTAVNSKKWSQGLQTIQPKRVVSVPSPQARGFIGNHPHQPATNDWSCYNSNPNSKTAKFGEVDDHSSSLSSLPRELPQTMVLEPREVSTASSLVPPSGNNLNNTASDMHGVKHF